MTPNGRPLHRAVFWTLIATKVIGGWGLQWDIRWHVTIGRDSFWIAPHVMIYASVAVGALLAFGVLVYDTLTEGGAGTSMPTVLGLSSSRGFHLAAWGIAVVVLAAPIDDLWHRLFGLDVTLWSPPHLLGLGGAAMNTLGCLLIAAELYPRDTRPRLVAVVVVGAILWGGLRATLDPAYLLAYQHGGVLFHAYAILAALLLPLALLPAARLSRWRWAPGAVVGLAILLALAGELVADAGFAVVRPVSAIGEEIAKDPTSPIATANAIRTQNGGAPPAWTRCLALVAPLMMAAADPRLRPVGGTVVHGVALFATSGWYLASRPAFQPLIPGPTETVVALIVAVAAALVGALGARWLADRLEPSDAPDLEPLPRPVG
jgi:hypothetical protein